MSYYRVSPDYLCSAPKVQTSSQSGYIVDRDVIAYNTPYRVPYILASDNEREMNMVKNITNHKIRGRSHSRWDSVLPNESIVTINSSRNYEVESISAPNLPASWDTISQGVNREVESISTPNLTASWDTISQGVNREDGSVIEPDELERAIALSKLFYLAEYGELSDNVEPLEFIPLDIVEPPEVIPIQNTIIEQSVIPIDIVEPSDVIPIQNIVANTSSNDIHLNTECAVCFENARCIMFKPCGHVCCCESCADDILALSTPKCPLCRQDLKSKSKTKVFL